MTVKELRWQLDHPDVDQDAEIVVADDGETKVFEIRNLRNWGNQPTLVIEERPW